MLAASGAGAANKLMVAGPASGGGAGVGVATFSTGFSVAFLVRSAAFFLASSCAALAAASISALAWASVLPSC